MTNSKCLDTTVPVPSTISAFSATMSRGSVPGSVGSNSSVPASRTPRWDSMVASRTVSISGCPGRGVRRGGHHRRRRSRVRRWRVRSEWRSAEPHRALPGADGGRHVGDLVAALLASADPSAESFEGVAEEQLDVVGLQAPGAGFVHLTAQHAELVWGQRLAGQCAFPQEVFGALGHLGVQDAF